MIIHVQSFPPVSDRSAAVLVLGSMPGRRSLDQGQYYAHPRNLFWPFIEAIFGVPKTAAYGKRCDALKTQGIALWDTLKACSRSGSLDADIERSTMVANDFAGFLSDHPNIELIVFNGATAEKVFMKLVAPTVQKHLCTTRLVRLPSTSPANASIPFGTKLAAWQVIGGLGRR